MDMIKFRGHDLAGRVHYGDFIHTKLSSTGVAIIDRLGQIHPVLLSTIAQFVDYDRSGRGVYVGDVIRHPDGTYETVTLNKPKCMEAIKVNTER